jgi:hypothetical protein
MNVHHGVYLHIFQERLSGVGNGLEEGSLEATGKDSHSISGDSQTCYNVVQPNLSDTELGGHLGRESLGSRYQYVIICTPRNFYCHCLVRHRVKDVMSLYIFRYLSHPFGGT